jgi:hypothetical protein
MELAGGMLMGSSSSSSLSENSGRITWDGCWLWRSYDLLFSLFTILRTRGEDSADDADDTVGGLGDLKMFRIRLVSKNLSGGSIQYWTTFSGSRMAEKKHKNTGRMQKSNENVCIQPLKA